MKTIIVLLVLTLSLPVMSMSGDNYQISSSSIDGGGGHSTSADYAMTATIGQPDVGEMAGDDYGMLGGFLPGMPLCIVDFEHFARFARYWLDMHCNVGNDWCSGADLDQLGDVDMLHLKVFLNDWLYYCPHNWPLK